MTLTLSNPILTAETRTRLRGRKGVIVQAAYLLILSVAVGILYLIWGAEHAFGRGNSWRMGQYVFQTLAVAQAILLALIAPSLTCGTLTLERERGTLDFLLMTPMRASTIILGKLLSAFLFTALLLIMSLPLSSVSFLLGGVSPGEIAGVYVALILESLLFCSIGLSWSATFARTSLATPFAYGSVLLYLGATALLFVLNESFGYMAGGPGGGGAFVLSGMNPIALPFCSTKVALVLGKSLPLAVPAAAINLLLTLTVLSVAIHQMGVVRGRPHPSLPRVLTLITVVTGFALTALNFIDSTAVTSLKDWAECSLALALILLGSLSVLAHIFATCGSEEASSPRQALGAALNPLRLFHGRASTAAGYLLLTLTLCFGMLAGTAYMLKGPFAVPTARPEAVPHAAPKATPTPPPTVPSWTAQQAHHWCWGILTRLFILCASAVILCVSIGWFFSSVASNRWAALTLALLVIVFVALFPLTGVATFHYENGRVVHEPYANILYACPYYAAAWTVMTDDLGDDGGMPRLAFDLVCPFWIVTTVLQLAGALALTAGAGVLLRRRQRLKLDPAPAKPPDTAFAPPDPQDTPPED